MNNNKMAAAGVSKQHAGKGKLPFLEIVCSIVALEATRECRWRAYEGRANFRNTPAPTEYADPPPSNDFKSSSTVENETPTKTYRQ
jgi:hypothetical protein